MLAQRPVCRILWNIFRAIQREVETAFKGSLARCWQMKTRCCLELFPGRHQNLVCTQNRKDFSTLFLVGLTDFFSKHTFLFFLIFFLRKIPFCLHEHLLFNWNTFLLQKPNYWLLQETKIIYIPFIQIIFEKEFDTAKNFTECELDKHLRRILRSTLTINSEGELELVISQVN